MKVNIVCCEDVNSWILGKFARKMLEELTELGIETKISDSPDNTADVNHYIIYLAYDNRIKTNIDTLMITHVDTLEKHQLLQKQLDVADMGICMSRQSMMILARDGLESSKLCFINPAHDGVIKPRPFVIGITSRVYDDGRKKESVLLELSKKINPEEFSFKIMGEGWDDIVGSMRSRGYKVEYYSAFDYSAYVAVIPSLDYYLYFGEDEGSMGFIDALSAGVPTIVTPQGFHLDVQDGIVYSVRTAGDIVNALESIAAKKRRLVSTVAGLTWKNYTLQHVGIWKHLLERKTHGVDAANCPDWQGAPVLGADVNSLDMGWFAGAAHKMKLLSNQIRIVTRSWKRKQ